jgi:hypothetical protein
MTHLQNTNHLVLWALCGVQEGHERAGHTGYNSSLLNPFEICPLR